MAGREGRPDPGNGRSDRPADERAYEFEHYYRDFVAVFDQRSIESLAVVGVSATAMTAIRLAAAAPQRVTHLIVAGGYAESLLNDPAFIAKTEAQSRQMREDWPAYLDWFFATVFSEPHSTKQYEDGVRYGWASTGQVVDWCRTGWLNQDLRDPTSRWRRTAPGERRATLLRYWRNVHGSGKAKAALWYAMSAAEFAISTCWSSGPTEIAYSMSAYNDGYA